MIVGLWAIVQMDPELLAIDLEDTLQNARYVAGVAAPMLPGADMNRLVAACVMLIQFSLYAGRLARDMPPEIGQEFPAAYKLMLHESIESLKRATEM